MSEITYSKIGDYLIPNLVLSEPEEYQIGVWGQRRLNYLKKHKRIFYTNLLTSCKLDEHLAEVDKQANDRLDLIIKQMAEKQGITEQLKAQNQMAWVGAMNNIKVCAEEVVLNEMIYN